MAEPLKVVCFKWKPRPKKGYSEPPHVVSYGPEHVLTLRNMVARHLSMDHEFLCVTDDPEGLEDVETLPLWDHCVELGHCFNRLYTFSEDMADLIGPRFVCIDLDCVIVDSLDPLFGRDEDFVVNSHKGGPNAPDQLYNGGLYMMDAGARSEVWETWDGERSAQRVLKGKRDRVCSGSDQGWMRLVLGRGEARWTEDDGTYEARTVRGRLPDNARIVLFAGKRDPTQWVAKYDWVREHYR